MSKIGYALLAVLLIVFIPACSTSTEVQEEVQVVTQPTRPMTVYAYCHDTPMARVVMKRIIRDVDSSAYRRLMGNKKSPCSDVKMDKTPPLLVQFTEDIGTPFKNKGGLCIQLIGFKDVNGNLGFSWMPVTKTKCGQAGQEA